MEDISIIVAHNSRKMMYACVQCWSFEGSGNAGVLKVVTGTLNISTGMKMSMISDVAGFTAAALARRSPSHI